MRKTLEKLNLDSSENSGNETSWKSRKGKCKMLSSKNCFKERGNTLILKEVSFFLLKFHQSFSCPRQLQYLSESYQNKGRRLLWWWKYYSKKEATELGWGYNSLCTQELGNFFPHSFKQKGLVCTKLMTTRFTREEYLAFYPLLFEKQVWSVSVLTLYNRENSETKYTQQCEWRWTKLKKWKRHFS